MKLFITLFLASSIIFISSCGPSEEEKARIAAEARESLIQEQAAKAALETSLKKKRQELSETKKNLIETRALAEAAKDRMNRIKQFQFGRTASEREQQIMDQSILIQRLEENVSILQSNIPILEDQVTDLKQQLQY